jgi:tetratricopeptide (TPR) repeat protein
MLCLFTDLRVWSLARRNRQSEAFRLWRRLCAVGMPPLGILMHLGEEAHRARDWNLAIETWEKAMALYPEAPLPPRQAADSYKEKGDTANAIACLRRSLALSPCQAGAHRCLGGLLRERNDNEQALRHLQLAVHLDPCHPSDWLSLGHMLYLEGKHRAAAVCFERANRMEPSHYAALHLGYCAFYLEDHETALSELCEALKYMPSDMDALSFKGLAQFRLNRFEEAIMTYEAMRAIDPARFDENETYRKNLFSFYIHVRHHSKILGPSSIPAHACCSAREAAGTRWQGTPLHGKTLLVFQDSGFGDTLQAMRYMQKLKRVYGAARLILAVWPQLTRLFQSLPAVDEVHSIFAIDLKKIDCDHYVDECTLMLLVGPHPVQVPYLKADPELVAAWRARLGTDCNVKVGIAWAGNPSHSNDRHRSIALQDLLPLSNLPQASLYALQKGDAVSQVFALPELCIAVLDGALTDFADSAALMSELDLVISVDSSPVHLAGALGVPAWVLVPGHGTDWRWHKGRSDCPWYPSLRLFHQAPGERWSEVIGRVRAALFGLQPGNRLQAEKGRRGESA